VLLGSKTQKSLHKTKAEAVMKTSAFALRAVSLLLGGSALGQTQQAPIGSLGEAAPAIGTRPTAGNIALGAVVPNPGSFQMHPVNQKVDITDQMMLNSDHSDDWIVHGRTYDNQRFSPFTQINKSNAKQLRPAAIIQTGITKTTEMTPIEVDGVLYLETGDNNIQAYDAVTGKELWAYAPTLGYSNLCCGQQSRGVAVAYGKVYGAQLDGHVVALDARTGNLIWKTDHADALPQPAYFYSFTMAPIAYNGLILVGNAGALWRHWMPRPASLFGVSTPPRRPTNREAKAGAVTAGNLAAVRFGIRQLSTLRTI
jgi:hypothetical protein